MTILTDTFRFIIFARVNSPFHTNGGPKVEMEVNCVIDQIYKLAEGRSIGININSSH